MTRWQANVRRMTVKPRLTITTASESREKHLDALSKFLGPTEALIVTVDSYGDDGHMVLHIPLDPKAEVVAREPPRLLPGGVTELISYVRCPATTGTLEVTIENSEVCHRREITPSTERHGKAPARGLECP